MKRRWKKFLAGVLSAALALNLAAPLALAGSVYYCWLLALSAIGFMLWPRRAAPQR